MRVSFENNTTAELYATGNCSKGTFPDNVVKKLCLLVQQILEAPDVEDIKSLKSCDFDGKSMELCEGYRIHAEAFKYHIAFGEIFQK